MAKPATQQTKSMLHASFLEGIIKRLANSRSTPADALESTVPFSRALLARDEQSRLQTTIEEQIIPRLLIAHQLPRGLTDSRRGRLLPTAEEVLQLTCLAAQPDLPGSLDVALSLLGAGLSLETVLLHLITPAARYLGQEWVEDRRSFTDVTVGLGTLHEIVHILGPQHAEDNHDPRARGSKPRTATRGSAVLLQGPGEQHTLGLHIFAQLLRHSRWKVVMQVSTSADELIRCLSSQSFDAVCISISSPERVAETAELISAVKCACLNPAVQVMVGGPVDLSAETGRLGASFWSDARDAVDHLEDVFDRDTRR